MDLTVPIAVGLDMKSGDEAVEVAEAVVSWVGAFKVGVGLLHGPGPTIIERVGSVGRPVFADAKLHDIPSQVEQAAYRLGQHGARWVTAHVSGGRDMLEAAVSGLARGSEGRAAGILGVSVLTSLDYRSLTEVGIDASPGYLVGRMAKLAADTGCEGLVCSPRELGIVGEAAPGLARVTPGIRPVDVVDDQARTATPAEALALGADMLVIGRPIAAAPDPRAAAEAIAASIE